MKLSYAIAKCIIKVFIVRKLAFRAVEKGRALVEVSEHFISKIETDRTAQTQPGSRTCKDESDSKKTKSCAGVLRGERADWSILALSLNGFVRGALAESTDLEINFLIMEIK